MMPDLSQNERNSLIGADTLSRPYESLYAYVSRLIRGNMLSEREIKKLLPVDWLAMAFNPAQRIEATLRNSLVAQGVKPADVDIKASTRTWIPFTSLSSVPEGALRGCPACFAKGFHSLAFQSDLLLHCPVHHVELSHHCPECGAPLVWRAGSPSRKTFRCSRGCELRRDLYSDLGENALIELNQAFGKHHSSIKVLVDRLLFLSGPIYTSYPPYEALRALGTPLAPSRGLLQGVCNVARRIVLNLPAFDHMDPGSDPIWRIQISPWADTVRLTGENPLKTMGERFRRGSYHTQLPLADCKEFAGWLQTAPGLLALQKKYGWALVQTNKQVVEIPSWVMPSSEFLALGQLFDQKADPEVVVGHYQVLLKEAIIRGYDRLAASQDLSNESSDAISLAESMDGVVQLNDELFRIFGSVHRQEATLAMWHDHVDQVGSPDE